MPIRPAEPADLPRLQEIETAAGEAFRAIGMPEIADDEIPPLDWYDAYRTEGRAWVYELDAEPVAYLLMDVVEGLSHIEQVSVPPPIRRARSRPGTDRPPRQPLHNVPDPHNLRQRPLECPLLPGSGVRGFREPRAGAPAHQAA